jgi:hypothetical protein
VKRWAGTGLEADARGFMQLELQSCIALVPLVCDGPERLSRLVDEAKCFGDRSGDLDFTLLPDPLDLFPDSLGFVPRCLWSYSKIP